MLYPYTDAGTVKHPRSTDAAAYLAVYAEPGNATIGELAQANVCPARFWYRDGVDVLVAAKATDHEAEAVVGAKQKKNEANAPKR